jgi:hypothetical protein
MSYPDGAKALARELGRVLDARGRLVVRAFVPPTTREAPEAVVRDLRARRMGSFHVFKWRLLMSLVAALVRRESPSFVTMVWPIVCQ